MICGDGAMSSIVAIGGVVVIADIIAIGGVVAIR